MREEEPSSLLFNNELWPPDYTNSNLVEMSLPAVPLTFSKPMINTTNPAVTSPPILDLNKVYHPEWGVVKDQDFHHLTLKHQRDLEQIFQGGSAIEDFHFWQSNLGGYCMANMIQGNYYF